MSTRSLYIYFMILVLVSIGFTTSPIANLSGSITGYVYDLEFDFPLEYTNIILYDQAKKTRSPGLVLMVRGASI